MRRATRRADQPRRAGVLALLVRQHRHAQGVRAPAARHGRLRRALRQGRARHRPNATAASASPSCSSPTASATRCTFRSRSAPPAFSGRGRPTPANVYAVIERHRPTLFFSVPTGYGMLLAHDGRSRTARARTQSSRPTSTCRRFARGVGRRGAAAARCTTASSSASASRSSTASARPKCCTCSSRTGPARSGPARAARSSPATRRGCSTTTAVADAAGEIGNLWISGDSICAGYWNQHEKTKHTIEGHWIRTGDKYYQDADGYLLVRRPLRRHAEGRRLVGEPGRSRERARRAPGGAGVRRRRARGSRRAREADGVRRAARRRVRITAELAAELQQFVREQLAEYKRPRWVEFIAELPKTATGKIQRFRLRA